MVAHRLLRAWRSVAAGPSRVGALLKGAVLLYVVGSLALAGVLLGQAEELLGEPAQWLGRGVLWGLFTYGAVRLLMERPVVQETRPYMVLPLSRSALTGYTLISALLSRWSWAPAAFWLPFWAVAVVPAYPPLGAAAYAAGLLAGVAVTTHLAAWLRQALSLRTAPTLLGLAAVAVAGVLLERSGAAALADLSAWLALGLLRGEAGPVLVVAGLYAVAFALHAHQVWMLTYLDEGRLRHPRRTRSAGVLGWLDERPPLGPWMALELRLIARHKSTRYALFPVLTFVAISLVLAWSTSNTALDWFSGELSGIAKAGAPLMQGIYTVGAFAFFHGINMFSYEGAYMDGFMARASSYTTMVRAKLILLWGGTSLLFLIPLPAALYAPPRWAALQAVFYLYSMGLLCPLILLAAHFNNGALDLDNTGPSFGVFSVPRAALGLVGVVVFPLWPFLWSSTMSQYLWSIAGIGAVSALCLPLWLRLMKTVWHRRYYIFLHRLRTS
ncbi:MAG: DUF5687 family protein [Bacteroidota bacterium]